MTTTAAKQTFRKGDTVFYDVGNSTVRARVETVHRDGSMTVGAMFFVDANGDDVPGYLGYRYRRMSPDLFRDS